MLGVSWMSKLRINKITKSQLSEEVADTLKESIFALDYIRGERLIVENLAEKMHVSMTPVRDGLKQLVSDGIVEYNGKSYSVFNPTQKDIQNLFLIRRYLEMLSAKSAAINIRIDVLNNLLGRCAELMEDTNIDKQSFIQFDTEFHRTLVDSTDNTMLIRMLKPIEDQCYLIRLWGYQQEFPQIFITRTLEEHIAILEAVRIGDSAKAELEMKKHIIKGEKRAWHALEKCKIFRLE